MPARSVRGGFAAQPGMDPATPAGGLRAGDAVGGLRGDAQTEAEPSPAASPETCSRQQRYGRNPASAGPASGTHKHTRFALQAAPHPATYPLDGRQGAAGLRDIGVPWGHRGAGCWSPHELCFSQSTVTHQQLFVCAPH